jgi:probable F420-dependent oxidoreductase
VKFVTSMAFSNPSQLGALARGAERAGFACITLSDHVVHPDRIETPYPYTPDGQPRWEPFTDWPDPWVAISAMAAVTERIRFFTSVFVLPLRNPFLVAKTVGTAAVLSDNRIALGIGAGWMRDEFELMGQSFDARGRRMDEMLDVLGRLWSGGMVEYHGDFYDFDPLEMSPVPSEPIPVYVGGVSKPARRRAATRGDGWISDLHTTAELGELLADVLEMRAASDRADEPFEVLVTVSDAYDLDGYRRLEEMGVTHLTTIPWLFYGGQTDSLAQKLDGLARFGDEVIAKLA